MQKSLKLYQSLENLSLNRSDDELRDNKACNILWQIPKYLLDATEEYREGRQYYESSLFDIAQSKFSNAISFIALHDAHYISESDVFASTTSGILSFLHQKCEESTQKKISLAKPGLNNVPIYSVVAALNDDDHPIPKVCDEILPQLSPDILQGIICVFLADIVMSLALCHKMKGNHQDYEELCQASHRLHLILYGPDTLKPCISSGNLRRLFTKENCQVEGKDVNDEDLQHNSFIYFGPSSDYTDTHYSSFDDYDFFVNDIFD